MKKSKALALFTMFATAACAQPFTSVPVETFEDGSTNVDDKRVVYYGLPRTTMIVTADVKAVKRSQPKCAALTAAANSCSEDDGGSQHCQLKQLFSDANFDLKRLNTEATMKVGHTEFALATGAMQDPAHLYAIELEGKVGHRRELVLETGLDGLLLNGSNNAENRGGDIAAKVVVETFAAVAKIVGSFFGATETPDDLAVYLGEIDPVEDGESSEVCYRALQKIASLEKEYKALQDQRTALLGDPKADLPERLVAYTAAQKNIKGEREDLQVLFAGERTFLAGKVRCEIDPKDAKPGDPTASPHTLWTLWPDVGLQLQHSSCATSAEFIATTTTTGGKAVTLEVSTQDVNAHATNIATVTEPEDTDQTVIHYRVPGRAKLSLLEDGQPLIVPIIEPIAQFGVVRQLMIPEKTNKVELGFKLHPKTGALIKVDVKVGREDTTLPEIGKIGDATGSLVEDIRDARKPDRADEVTQKLLDACEASLATGEVSDACDVL